MKKRHLEFCCILLLISMFMSIEAYAMQIFVKMESGKNVIIEVEPTEKIEDVKAKIGEKATVDSTTKDLVLMVKS